MAKLAEEGFESFEEDQGGLIGYIQERYYTHEVAAAVQEMNEGDVVINEIAQRNWNADWESAFEPVHIEGFCTIRAGFHAADTSVQHEIVITPRMSFGTGHHATTRLMIKEMSELEFSGKDILDFGTGTGVLAILAKKLGAASVMAIDNDEWSYENTLENIAANGISGIEVDKGSFELAKERKFDIILANINRHILLEYMRHMYGALRTGGVLLMSGILQQDEQSVKAAAIDAGFGNYAISVEDKWLCIRVIRI